MVAPIIGSAIAIVTYDTLFSFFAGIGMFGIMGYIKANEFPISSPTGMDKIFIMLPSAITAETDSPHFWSFCFFTCLFFFSVSTQMSWIETIVAMLYDVPMISRKISRAKIVACVCSLSAFFATFYTSNWGFTYRSVVNGGAQSTLIMFMTLFQAAGAGWFYRYQQTAKMYDRSSTRILFWSYWIPLVLTGVL